MICDLEATELFLRVALRRESEQDQPKLFNTDPEAQFTVGEFTDILHGADIPIGLGWPVPSPEQRIR